MPSASQEVQRLLAIGRLRESYAEAVLAGDEPAAMRTASEAVGEDIPETMLYDAIIAPAMRKVGERWATGEISIAEEHLATQITTRIIARQREASRVAADRPNHRIVLCGLEKERHTIGLEMAASVLRHAGYDVRMLGADVPIETLTRAVERYQPDIVGFSVTIADTAIVLPAAIYEVRAADPTVGIIIGGLAASLRMEATAATTICANVADVVDVADQLVQRAGLN